MKNYSSVTMARIFPGLWKKIAPVFIGLTALGWLLVVIGFGIGSKKVEDVKDGENFPTLFAAENTLNDRSDANSFPLWVVSLSGVALIVASLAHAALWSPYSGYIGAIAGFLSVWFVSGLGMILYDTGSLIRYVKDNDDSITRNVEIPDWYSLEFAGAFLALLFWTPVIMLWPLYGTPAPISSRLD